MQPMRPSRTSMVTRKVTYFDRRAETTEFRLAGPTGYRIVCTRWIDDADERSGGHPAGTITEKVITGDFRKGTGKVLVDTKVVCSNPWHLTAPARLMMGCPECPTQPREYSQSLPTSDN